MCIKFLPLSLQKELGVRDCCVLIINCLSLLFGNWGCLGDKPFFFFHKQEMEDTERLLCPGGPCRVLLRFSIFRKMLIMHIHVSFAYGIRKFKGDIVNSLLHFLGNKCPLNAFFFF